jgi:hypothetical protein
MITIILRQTIAMATLLCSCLTVGCSPYVYSAPIQKFSAVSQALTTSYQSTAQNILADQTLTQRTDWMISKPKIAPGNGCTEDTEIRQACALLNSASRQSAAPNAIDAQPGLTAEAVLKSISDYAAAIAALSTAADRTAFDTASTNVATAVGALAASAGKFAGPIGSAFVLAKPVASAVLWLVGQKLDYDRLVVLRDAVSKADPSIQVLATKPLPVILSGQNLSLQTAIVDLLSSQIEAVNVIRAHPPIKDVDYSTALDTAQATASALNAARAADPYATAKALADAHSELKAAVISNDGQLDALGTSIETFSQQVSAIVKAAQSARVVSK